MSPLQYAMKTQSRHSAAATTPYHAHNYGSRSHRVTKPTTSPATSPRAPYSVGQNQPPRLSPAVEAGPGRAPSPNYFGLVVESGGDPRESSGLAHHNWSPSSSVKSFGAALPKQVAMEPNSDFEAFKKAVDLNMGRSSFTLATPQSTPPGPCPTSARHRPPRWHPTAAATCFDASSPKPHHSPKPCSAKQGETPDHEAGLGREAGRDSAYASSDSKRNDASTTWQPSQLPGMPRFESPGSMETSTQTPPVFPRQDATDSRLSLHLPKVGPPSPQMADANRAATVPPKLDHAPPIMVSGEELKDLVETVPSCRFLLLDIRSAQSFTQSHIRGALNICIPTTLLKRATFNIHRLQQNFQGNLDSAQFSRWREMDWIVVYDAHASDKRDAVTAQNMIKKFTNEGYAGKTAILRGGFTMFQNSFPSLVVKRSPSSPPLPQKSASGKEGGNQAAVFGGVSLPTMQNDHNPFFSNIRQNMDLADGVGQYDIARPRDLQSPLLPCWIREASNEADHGKKVSNRFLDLELEEQARMRTAYAAFNPNQKADSPFQLSGVEKGTKNRYKDILPFEHARVRLQISHGSPCDYVNASHLSASRSNKRYIASQGPLPATFE
ncbi:hypothetical protein E4U42_000920, partial [Claviceps africana]